jgi:hypothetical protein
LGGGDIFFCSSRRALSSVSAGWWLSPHLCKKLLLYYLWDFYLFFWGYFRKSTKPLFSVASLIPPIIIKFLLVFSAQFLEVGVLSSPIFSCSWSCFFEFWKLHKGCWCSRPQFFLCSGVLFLLEFGRFIPFCGVSLILYMWVLLCENHPLFLFFLFGPPTKEVSFVVNPETIHFVAPMRMHLLMIPLLQAQFFS